MNRETHSINKIENMNESRIEHSNLNSYEDRNKIRKSESTNFDLKDHQIDINEIRNDFSILTRHFKQDVLQLKRKIFIQKCFIILLFLIQIGSLGYYYLTTQDQLFIKTKKLKTNEEKKDVKKFQTI